MPGAHGVQLGLLLLLPSADGSRPNSALRTLSETRGLHLCNAGFGGRISHPAIKECSLISSPAGVKMGWRRESSRRPQVARGQGRVCGPCGPVPPAHLCRAPTVRTPECHCPGSGWRRVLAVGKALDRLRQITPEVRLLPRVFRLTGCLWGFQGCLLICAHIYTLPVERQTGTAEPGTHTGPSPRGQNFLEICVGCVGLGPWWDSCCLLVLKSRPWTPRGREAGRVGRGSWLVSPRS